MMKSVRRSRIAVAAVTAIASLLLLSATSAFSPGPLPQPRTGYAPASAAAVAHARPSAPSPRHMSLSDVSDFYAQFPLQSAVLTCGVKASVADGIAQLRKAGWDDLEFRRNLAYVLYGGVVVGALCHFEYDLVFPLLFGDEHNLWTSFRDDGPLVWLPPAYLVKAMVYGYELEEGLRRYAIDVKENGLLQKYWAIWLPAQSISFTVVPDHLRVAFMASVSFFWFILFSTVSESPSSSADGNGDTVTQ
ncbi:hypothetical protein ACHAWF_003869 [Thalassiosira exigua]